jgi:hypothetical protein
MQSGIFPKLRQQKLTPERVYLQELIATFQSLLPQRRTDWPKLYESGNTRML